VLKTGCGRLNTQGRPEGGRSFLERPLVTHAFLGGGPWPQEQAWSSQIERGARMAVERTATDGNHGDGALRLGLAAHRRVLSFLNEAIQPKDSMFERMPPPNPEVDQANVSAPAGYCK